MPAPDSPTAAPRWKVPDVAAFFSVDERTILRWCQRGQIPHFRIGKLYRFDPAQLQALFDSATPKQS